MKNLLAVGALMLGLGFAIGWVAKPVPVVKEAAAAVSIKKPSTGNTPSQATADPIVQGKRSERDLTPKKPAGITEEQMKQGQKMQAEMAKQMVKRVREKFEKQIDKLAESLNLSADQKAALTAWLDGKISKFEELDASDPKAMASVMEISKELTNKGLEEQLASSLSPEQKTALAEFKDKEHRGKVDALALKSLSKLQGVIEFQEGQRDEVYKILAEGAEGHVNEEEGGGVDPTAMFTEGMGIEMDPYDLGLQKVMTEAMGDPAQFAQKGGDQKEAAKTVRAAIDKRIDLKVESLRPVLNDKQLEQYRTELKTKGLGIYGPMLMSLEGQ